MSHVKVGKLKIPVPKSKSGRRVLGGALLTGGAFSFLPVLGVWMIPAGLVVLSVDSPQVRKIRRRQEVRLIRWWRKRGKAQPPE